MVFRCLGRLTVFATFAALAACTAHVTAIDEVPKPVPAEIEDTAPVELVPVAFGSSSSLSRLYPDVPSIGKAILVNIPSYELIAFENGRPVMRSRVIVGKPSTPTPVMETATSVVRFRPTWTPTPRMIRSGKYRPGTRPPGKRNPLGFLAIRLAPGMLIYLHGTNKPQLFDKDRRAMSHGCVRVERWDEIAAWVLDIDVEDVHRHAHGRRTFDMQTAGVPVIMGYYTRFPDAEGVMQDWPDIYRRGTNVMASRTL
ncbi:MAG: L,D-transpeptidase family protein [Pseudomonadota bacterium]